MAPEEVAFLVIVSGGGASTEDENLYSIRTHLEDRGIGPEGINQALDLRRQIDAYYRTGDGRQALLADLVRAEDSDWFAAADWYLPRASEVYLHGSDEWRAHLEFLDFDALPLLRELDMPMLFVHGALDRSYPATLSAERLTELASDPARDVQVVTYPGADHGILTRRLPWPRYADGYVEHLVTWVERRFTTGDP
jgi:pimeloyl-ACP methyl ester carboxylesterase